jgi:hypothetical protein
LLPEKVFEFFCGAAVSRSGNDLINEYPPSPLIFWNDGVRGGLPPKSLRNKDLYAKYSGIRS